jgi:hypothetical protein
MGAYFSGYAFGHTSILELQTALLGAGNGLGLEEHPLIPNHGIEPLMQVEIREFEHGLYLDTAFELKNDLLFELSKKMNIGIMKFMYNEGSMAFLCRYFQEGNWQLHLLEREKILYSEKQEMNEYEGMGTDEIIDQLFLKLTGASLMNCQDIDGELYYFKNMV